MLRANGGGVLLVPSGSGESHGETFRQLDDFLYFSGLELPSSILALDADELRTVLFAPNRDARFQNPGRPNDFPGRPLTDDPNLGREAGIGAIVPMDAFDEVLSGWISEGRTFWVDLGRPGPAETTLAETAPGKLFVEPSPEETFLLRLAATYGRARFENAFPHVAALRLRKSEREIGVMRQTAELTSAAIARAAVLVRPGVSERALAGEFEAGCKAGGAQRLAFASIVKSGPNSLRPWRILAAHYDRRDRLLQDGELVVFDVGCELNHYASDVGRTFPVSGRFSDEQAELLRMVNAVSDAIVDAVRPGVTLRDLQAVAREHIPVDQRPYMQTGLFFGHHLGLSVDDPTLPDEPLAPGMVFTVEPWYYNHDREIAVFVEDEILVTESGADVLTAALPRTPGGLEELMRGRQPE